MTTQKKELPERVKNVLDEKQGRLDVMRVFEFF